MQPWQRYSVAVYLGLLLAGTLVAHPPAPAPGSADGVYLDPYRPEMDEPQAAEPQSAHDACSDCPASPDLP